MTIEIDLKIKHHMPTPGNGVYMKEMHLPAGHYAETHSHEYDHFGLLAEGWAEVELGGEIVRHMGPCVVEIKAGKKHKITALTDLAWFCIHATTETDSSKIDEVLIKGE